jgi:hypothetical protein
MVLTMARQEAGLHKQRPNSRATFSYAEAIGNSRCSNKSWKPTLGEPGNLTENRQSDILKQESTYSFSWG